MDEPLALSEPRRRRLDGEVALIVGRLRSGTSIRALAAEYGVSREAIRRALARAGVVIDLDRQPPPDVPHRRRGAHRLPGRGRSRALAPDELAALLARHRAGESLRSLAREVGVSHETLRRSAAEASAASGIPSVAGAATRS